MGGISWYSTLIAAFFVLAGVIRLGYFNVQEINRVRRDPGRRQTYDGLPITSSSIILPLVGLIDILVKARCSWIYPVTLGRHGTDVHPSRAHSQAAHPGHDRLRDWRRGNVCADGRLWRGIASRLKPCVKPGWQVSASPFSSSSPDRRGSAGTLRL